MRWWLINPYVGVQSFHHRFCSACHVAGLVVMFDFAEWKTSCPYSTCSGSTALWKLHQWVWTQVKHLCQFLTLNMKHWSLMTIIDWCFLFQGESFVPGRNHSSRRQTDDWWVSLCVIKEQIQMAIKMILKYKIIELLHFDRKYQVLKYVLCSILWCKPQDYPACVVVGRN